MYSIRNLNGLAILVSNEKDESQEYICDRGTWFVRVLVKARFSQKNPRPPGIPQELVSVTNIQSESGSFYDQAAPTRILEGFEILGSFDRSELSTARRRLVNREDVGENDDKFVAMIEHSDPAGGWVSATLDPLIGEILKLGIVIGNTLVTVALDQGGAVRYQQPGSVVGVRVFDPKQRR